MTQVTSIRISISPPESVVLSTALTIMAHAANTTSLEKTVIEKLLQKIKIAQFKAGAAPEVSLAQASISLQPTGTPDWVTLLTELFPTHPASHVDLAYNAVSQFFDPAATSPTHPQHQLFMGQMKTQLDKLKTQPISASDL